MPKTLDRKTLDSPTNALACGPVSRAGVLATVADPYLEFRRHYYHEEHPSLQAAPPSHLEIHQEDEVITMANGQYTVQQPTHKESATERIFHAIRQTLLSILIALVGGVIVGIVVAEVVAAVLTQTTPTLATNLVALAVGLIVGYGAAATAIIWALVIGLAETVRAIAGDMERAGDRVLHELETHAGVADHHGTVEGTIGHRDQLAREAVLGGFAQAAPVSTGQRVVEVLTPPVVAQPDNHRNGQASEDAIGPLVPTPPRR